MLNRYLDIAPEVKKALDEGKPVVALESTIISHGTRRDQRAAIDGRFTCTGRAFRCGYPFWYCHCL